MPGRYLKASLDPRRAAFVLGLAIATLAALGAGSAWHPHRALTPFDLDGERNVPAAFSALLLLASAVLVLRLRRSVVPRAVAVIFSCLLVIASLDEAVEIHETLERRFEIDWQRLYIPGFLAVFIMWCLLIRALRRHRLSVALILASAACWAASQVLELLQWDVDGPVSGYTQLMVSEEVFEMAGSALLVVALLLALRADREVDSEPASVSRAA